MGARQGRILALGALLILCMYVKAQAQHQGSSSPLAPYYRSEQKLRERRDLAGAARLADSLEALGAHAPQLARFGRVVRADLLNMSGHPDQAIRLLEVDLPRMEDPFELRYLHAREHGRALVNLHIDSLASLSLRQALALAGSGSHDRERADCLLLLAEVDRQHGRYEEALAGFIEAERIAMRAGYSRGVCMALNDQGNINYYQGRWPEALDKYRAFLGCARAAGEAALVRKALNNIGSAIAKQDGPLQAIAHYEEALRENGPLGDTAFAARVEANIGTMYKRLKDLDKAEAHLRRSLALHSAIGDTVAQASGLFFLSAVLWEQGRTDSALATVRRSIERARLRQDAERIAEAEERYARWLRELGRYEEAFRHHDHAQALRDSLSTVKESEVVHRLEIQHATEKNRQRLALTEAELDRARSEAGRRREQRNLLLALAALLVVIAGLLVRSIRQQRHLRRNEQALHDQQVDELMRGQELRVLQATVRTQHEERERIAKDLHDRLGSLLSAVKLQFGALESRISTVREEQEEQYVKVYRLLDEAVSEVRRISHDMLRGSLARNGLVNALEDLRDSIVLKGRLEVELDVFGLEDRLDRSLEVTVYRIVQELVTNALKHARPSELSISVTRGRGRLSIIVADNGSGFDPSKGADGLGLVNVRQRAGELGGHVQVDTTLGKGTTVSVEIPCS